MRQEQIKQFEQALLSLDRQQVKNFLTNENGKFVSYTVIEELLVPALENIGIGWEEGKLALSQVYMSGRLCEEVLNELLPVLDSNHIAKPIMAITVFEDYHFLGMRLVYSVLRSSGFEILNYGRQEMDELIERVKSDKIRILLISVLMLRSALRIRELINKLKKAGLDVKVIAGGTPFRKDKQLAHDVGVDATAESATGALAVVKRMLEEVSHCPLQ